MTLKVVQGFVGPGSRSTAEAPNFQKDLSASLQKVSDAAGRVSQVATEAVVTTIKATSKVGIVPEKIKTEGEAKVLADKVARSLENDDAESFEAAHSLEYLGSTGKNRDILL